MISKSPGSFRSTLAVLSLAAVALAAAAPLAAQTAVSNLGQANGGSAAYVGTQGGGENRLRIVTFTTGNSAASFTFSGITANFSVANGSPPALTIGLYSAFDATTSGGVSGLLSNLSLSSGNPAAAGNAVYTGTATLSASTTYYLSFSAGTPAAGNNYNLSLANSHNEDSGGLAGWSIGNGHWYNYPNYAPNPDELWTFDGSAAQFSIQASAIPEPSTYAAIAGAAMLGLAVWRRRRQPAAPGAKAA